MSYKNSIRFILHAVVVPILLSLVVYYGFGTNYTHGVFHESRFSQQYNSGIYKYRILGRETVLAVHDFIQADNIVSRSLEKLFGDIPASVNILDPQAEPSFYAAYFIHNTLFLILSAVMLFLILLQISSPPDISRWHVIGILLMGLTQYVVCPYDTLSYFLILTCLYFIVTPTPYRLPILIVAVALCTLSRETSLFAIPFYIAYNYDRLIESKRSYQIELASIAAAFGAVYLALRFYYGFDFAFWANVRIKSNLTDFFNIAGLLSFPLITYVICSGAADNRKCKNFIIYSLPIILYMMAVSVGWEMRLWVPVWLSLICLASERKSPSNKPVIIISDDNK